MNLIILGTLNGQQGPIGQAILIRKAVVPKRTF